MANFDFVSPLKITYGLAFAPLYALTRACQLRGFPRWVIESTRLGAKKTQKQRSDFIAVGPMTRLTKRPPPNIERSGDQPSKWVTLL
ncbi:MAG TPA: hypothetical protein PK013_06230, partial [Thermosynergistes sp.]|nr:hypothetical protein [Thermosynergistes sp.]